VDQPADPALQQPHTLSPPAIILSPQQQQLPQPSQCSQSMLLQLMQGGGMQLVTFGDLQKDDEGGLYADDGAGGAAGKTAAICEAPAINIVAVHGLEAAVAAATAADGNSRCRTAGPVCEAVEHDASDSSLGVLEATAVNCTAGAASVRCEAQSATMLWAACAGAAAASCNLLWSCNC
jgi:hypothetical protein